MNAIADIAGSLGAEERRGIAEDLRLLALLHDHEPSAASIALLRAQPVEGLFVLPLGDARGMAALDFLAETLSGDVTRTDAAGLDDLAADYAAIYLTHSHRVSPSESPWIDPEGLTSQQPMFEVRDWYRHWGVEAPDWRKRPDDHLVVQLGFVAHLVGMIENAAAVVDAARFLDRHLLRWYHSFAEGVTARCWTPYFAAVAHLTDVYLETLRDRLGRIGGCERVDYEPIETEKQRLRNVAVEETCASAGAYVPGSAPTL